MHVLIVDDEAIIVNEVKSAIDWGELGFDEIYTAHNVRQAKEIFAQHRIDVMLCDIEMPQGSGLELLAWVREQSPHTESVILTCHADFSYAKEAIRLGSIDYLLKPIPYPELEQVVATALERIRNSTKLMEFGRYGEYWFKHQPIMIERFWSDLLSRTIPSTRESIREASEARNIPYSDEMTFLPVLLSIRRWHKEMGIRDQKIMEYGVRNIINEILLKEGANGQIIELGAGKLLVILSLWNNAALDRSTLKTKGEGLIQAIHQYMKCDVNGYVGTEVHAYELPKIAEQLLELEKNNVLYENKLLFWKEAQTTESKALVSAPDMDLWSILLMEGANERLLAEIGQYLERVWNHESFNAERLRSFQHDFMQMVYSMLKKKGIQAHVLLGDGEANHLYERSGRSVKDLKEWIRHVVMKITNDIMERDKSQSIVDKVKQYIELNMDQDLTREDIAAFCYLHPDYLDRVFKKEAGASVTKFIVQERLKKAGELLSRTELPISEIATMTGYKNMSHFSVAFKRFSSMNPIEYRKAYGIKK